MIEDSNIKAFKKVFIGELGVGKTSIISQFIYQQFYDSQNPTTVHFHKKTITQNAKGHFAKTYKTSIYPPMTYNMHKDMLETTQI